MHRWKWLPGADAEGSEGQLALLHELTRLLDLAHDTIMARRLDGTILFWNQGAARMYGYSPEEAVGRVSHELLKTVFPVPLHEIEKSLLEVGFWEDELKQSRRDGPITVDSRWVLSRNAEGAPVAVLEINNDITRRKEAEAERERQAAILRDQVDLLDLARDAIMVRQLDGTITFWNRGAERIYGYTKDEAIGQKSHTLLRTGFPAALVEIEHALREKGHWEGELIHSRRDGSTVLMDSRWVIRRTEGGEAFQVLELNSDITERKKAEAEEARVRQQQEVIRAQSVALAELSTPLIPITNEILVMPLIGVMDSTRASQVMDSLLRGISSSGGTVAIIDVTGVMVVDTEVASALMRAAKGARLLGAEVVLTGIRPDVAHTLISLGIDLSGVTTRGTLQSGIAYAMSRRAA